MADYKDLYDAGRRASQHWSRYTAEDVRLVNESDQRVPLSGFRARPATLSEGIRPGEDGRKAAVATETEEQKVHRAAYAITNSHRMSSWYSSWRRPSGRLPGLQDATVTVEDTVVDSRGEEPNGYDGAYEQGSEGEIAIIFKVRFDDGTDLFLKKVGFRDSYGENENWDGPWKVGRAKTMVVYE